MQATSLSSIVGYALMSALEENLSDFDFTHDASGISMTLRPQGAPALKLSGLRIDDQGLSGQLSLDTVTAPVETQLYGFTIALTAFDVTLQNGTFGATNISGLLTLPSYFDDQDGNPAKLDVEVGVRSDGFTVSLAAAQSDPSRQTPDGQVQLHIPLPAGSAIDLLLNRLEIAELGQVYQISLSGTLTLTAGGLSWPSVDFKDLRIDSKGNVSLDGGWIDLPSHTAVDFYGFHLGLQKLGFGRDGQGPGGHRYIGLNGDIQLVDGLALGGSVRGLRVDLETGGVTMEGVSIDFTVPGVLSFTGGLTHIQSRADALAAGLPPAVVGAADASQNPNNPTDPISVFLGGMSLDLIALQGLALDAQLIVGQFSGTRIFFLAFDVELPTPGIPLFAGISLFGVTGLFANNLRPDPQRSQHTFWDWYAQKPLFDTSGFDYELTDPRKWLPFVQPGALAFGAGASIGTSDGYAVNAKIALVLMLPGPVISFVGNAKILAAPSSDYSSYTFSAMATYDGTAQTFDLNIDAQYEIPFLLDLSGSAALHVGGGKWYFALGWPLRAKRIRARIFDIFEADAYFVISDSGVVFGAYIGYSASYSFGPLSAGFDVYLATIGAIQWSPFEFGGGIEVHGDAHLSAFGFGIGLSIDALLEGSAPSPLWIHGSVSVSLDLPWPLPDLGVSVSLEWGGNGPPPALPETHGQVNATMVDHAACSDQYTLTASSGPSTSDYDPVPPSGPPAGPLTVVPPDAHFAVRFQQPVADLTSDDHTRAGFRAAEAVTPTETMSAPSSITPPDDMSNLSLTPPKVEWLYQRTLLEISLYQSVGGGWSLVAAQPAPPGVAALLGVWVDATGNPQGTGASATEVNTRLHVVPDLATTEGSVAVHMGILPQTPAVFALKVVTQTEARRCDESSWQPALPAIDFWYFQTEGGPGTVSPSDIPAASPLRDLGTYTQWSYPGDGAPVDYYGYDVGVEFNETYVHRMYRALGAGDAGESVHLRCVDRNNRHVILDPVALHVPSLLAYSALVTEVLTLKQPTYPSPPPADLQGLWPAQLAPRTRYALDVVPGPSTFDGFCILLDSAADAVTDLTEYYQDEDALPSLQHIEFATSRYATFSDHLSGVTTREAPRRYAAATDALGWLAMGALEAIDVASGKYQAQRVSLASIVAGTSGMDAIAAAAMGPALASGRAATDAAWQTLSGVVASVFDGLAQALERSDLTREKRAPLPPDTERSLLVDAGGVIQAVLLESPEPLPWRRILLGGPTGTTAAAIWNVDGTRAFLLLRERPLARGETFQLTFQGNIGAEAPCITRCGDGVTEEVTVVLANVP